MVLTAAMSACQVSGEGAVEWTIGASSHTAQQSENTLKTTFIFFRQMEAEKNPM